MVCQAERQVMVKKGQDFEKHINHDHMFWKYCYYLAYLKDKHTVEMNGFEGLVYQLEMSKNTSWVPIDEDSLTEKQEAEEQDKKQKEREENAEKFQTSTSEQLEALKTTISEVMTKIDKPVETVPPA